MLLIFLKTGTFFFLELDFCCFDRLRWKSCVRLSALHTKLRIGVAALFYCSAVHFYCSTTDQQWGCVSVSLPCVSATEQQERPAIFFTSNSAALLVADLIFCTTESFRAPLCSLQLPNLEKSSITDRVTHGYRTLGQGSYPILLETNHSEVPSKEVWWSGQYNGFTGLIFEWFLSYISHDTRLSHSTSLW